MELQLEQTKRKILELFLPPRKILLNGPKIYVIISKGKTEITDHRVCKNIEYLNEEFHQGQQNHREGKRRRVVQKNLLLLLGKTAQRSIFWLFFRCVIIVLHLDSLQVGYCRYKKDIGIVLEFSSKHIKLPLNTIESIYEDLF